MPLKTIGWREWVHLPDLEIKWIKAKIDTGAKSSSLHAYDIEIREIDGRLHAQFKVHPHQNNEKIVVETQSVVHEYRKVRSSNGELTNRPVIRTTVVMFGTRQEIDVTLFDRSRMGFRMLLGREAIRNRFIVDPGASYCCGKPKKKLKRTDPE